MRTSTYRGGGNVLVATETGGLYNPDFVVVFKWVEHMSMRTSTYPGGGGNVLVATETGGLYNPDLVAAWNRS